MEHTFFMLKKEIDELNKKAEQGSIQLQGEVMELVLEDSLKQLFPYDQIEEIGKGIKGADIVHTVINKGNICGKIIYESKRTKNFSYDWIQKLKDDMMNCKADIAVLITETMPKEIKSVGNIEGIWICSTNDYKGLVMALRDGLVKVSEVLKTQENKSDKMVMLYDYLTGNEFKQYIEALVEGFINMRENIIREKSMMEKIWKEREKGLERMLLSINGFYGAIRGIAGSIIPDVNWLENPKLLE